MIGDYIETFYKRGRPLNYKPPGPGRACGKPSGAGAMTPTARHERSFFRSGS